MPGSGKLFDPIRHKTVAAKPEEQVRQALVQWLIEVCRVPARLIAVEYSLPIRERTRRRRADVVVWKPGGPAGGLSPWLLAECKAPGVALGTRTADQVRRYAEQVRAEWVLLTNGSVTRYFQLRDGEFAEYAEAARLPLFGF